MAAAGRWKPYTPRQGQLLPAFVEDALDPGDPAEITPAMQFRRGQLRGRAKARGEWHLVAAACNLRRLFALAPAPA
jgi:hypothetical protein